MAFSFASDAWALLQAHLLVEEGGSREEPSRLLRDFKQWLQLENTKLVQIIAARASTAEDLAAREAKLQVGPPDRCAPKWQASHLRVCWLSGCSPSS